MKSNDFPYRPKYLGLEHSTVQNTNLVQKRNQSKHEIKDLKKEEADKLKRDQNQLKQLLKPWVGNQKLLLR